MTAPEHCRTHARFYDWETRHLLDDPEADLAYFRSMAREHAGPILDAGCGTGRVARDLAAHGHRVVGVDHDPHMLELAQQAAGVLPKDQRPTWIRADLTSLSLGQRFGLILLACNTFACLIDTASQRRALRRLADHLAPQGRLVLDVYHLDARVENDGPEHVVTAPYGEDGTTVALYEERRYDPARDVLVFCDRYDVFGPDLSRQSCQRTFELRCLARPELELLLAAEGLGVCRVLADYDGTPHDAAHAERMVVVAQPLAKAGDDPSS